MSVAPVIDLRDPASDTDLLRLYARTQDADAFADLLRRHTNLVFAVARRILGNDHDAEDVTQAVFVEMACKAGSITSPLPAWLHTATTFRAINAMRDAATRRRHERHVAPQQLPPEIPLEPEWKDIEPLVDAAMESLPPELRRPLIMLYLQDRSQSEIATELGVNQSTVSRRLRMGLDLLRKRLRGAGVVASIAGLGALMMQNTVEAAPLSLKMSLGKMAMVGLTRSLSGARQSMDFDAVRAASSESQMQAWWQVNLKMTCGVAALAVALIIYLMPLLTRLWTNDDIDLLPSPPHHSVNDHR